MRTLSLRPINASKITPPQVRACLHRPRLAGAVRGWREHKLVLLTAAAGYGKTTLLADAFVRAATADAPFWYRLDPSDRDLSQFITYLLQLVRAQIPEFGARTVQALRQASESARDEAAAVFVHELSLVRSDGIVLVLDGFDMVADTPKVARLVSELLEFSPESVRFLVATRARPSLPLARLLAGQQLIELSVDDLAFTEAETRAFLVEHLGLSLSAAEVQSLHQSTEGWPAGLGMLARWLGRDATDRSGSVSSSSVASARALATYFAGQAFDDLPLPVQAFVSATSVLHVMTAEMCRELTGRADSAGMLRSLEEDGLFVRHVSDPPGGYRYHPLYRQFLQQRLTPVEASGLHARAAAALERGGNWAEALEHYCSADLWEDTTRLIEEVGERLIDAGRIDRVAYWFRRVPAESLAARPWCLALRGRILQRKMDYSGALHMFRAAQARFEQRGDLDGLTWVQCETAVARGLAGHLREASALCRSILDDPRAGPAARSHALATLSMCARGDGDGERAVEHAQAALAEAEQVVDDQRRLACRTRAMRHLALAHVYRLDFAAAHRYARANLAICERENASGFWVVWSLWTLGVLQALSGEHRQALATLDQATPLHSHLEQRQTEQLWLWRGIALRALGDQAAAEECFETAGEDGIGELVLLDLERGNLSRAQRRADDALQVRATGQAGCRLAEAWALVGIVLREQGELDGARGYLEQAVEAFRASGDRLSLTSVLLHRAALELGQGQRQRAIADVREAFDLSVPNGLRHFLWWHADTVAAVCALAFQVGIRPAYAAELAAGRLGAEHCGTFLPLLGTADPSVRPLVAGVVRALAGKLPEGDDFGSDLLTCAAEPSGLEHLAADLGRGLLSVEQLAALRRQFGMTWKEIQVFSAYYLRPGLAVGAEPPERFRQRTAVLLGISENTLKIHINSVRRKLGLTPRATNGAYLWACERGIAANDGSRCATWPATAPLERVGRSSTPSDAGAAHVLRRR